jgi:membrane protein DedA with SNARE-associated domain
MVDTQIIMEMVAQYGYPALFFALWLGIVGMPIPDEVVVLSAGVITSLGYLQPVPAFLLTYLGVVSGLSLGYILGKTLGAPVLDRFGKRKGMHKHIKRGQALLEQYGSYALCISYFFPVVRHVVPYLVGIGNMKFRQYALFSYTTGFVWTLLFFVTGNLLGNNAANIGQLITNYSMYALLAVSALCGLALVFRSMRRQSIRREDRGD